MNGSALSLVLLSGALHAVWNLFAKQSRSKAAFLWLAQWVAVLVFLPLAWPELLRMSGDAVSVSFALGSMALHGAYVYLLAKAYTLGDLSYVYPLIRGIGPLLVPMIGIAFLGERLTGLQGAGLVFLLSGICLMNGGTGIFRRNVQAGYGADVRKTFGYALAVGIAVAAYTVFDKAALDYGGLEPMALNALGNVGNALCLTGAAVRSGHIRSEWRVNRLRITAGGLFASGGYTLFLYALTFGDVSRLAPMREVGTVFGTVLGVIVLQEPQRARRLWASAVITAGVVLLGI